MKGYSPMTAEQISAIAATALSLFLAYFPFVKGWYDPLPNPQKVTVTGLLLVLVTAAALAYNCRADAAGLAACVAANWPAYASALIAALVANQGTYLLFVKPFKAK